jgi:hypothetical protein
MQLDAVGKGLAVPGRQVVDDDDAVAGAQQGSDEVTTDVAHPTGDKDVHGGTRGALRVSLGSSKFIM